MPILTREALRNSMRRGALDPVYLLFGSETYLRDLALRFICDRCFTEQELRDFNETEFSLNTDGNLASALAAAEQLPMLATRRVIRVVDVRVSATDFRGTLKEEDEATLEAYLKRPSPTSTIIFIADEFDKRRKIAKLFIDNATVVEFGDLSDSELERFARDEVRKVGSEIDDRALRLLVTLVGPDLRRLTIEIQKLSTAALPDKVISAEVVLALVANSREMSNFSLTDHLVAGRKLEALRALKKILDDGGEPLMLVGLISSNLRRLLMAKEAMAAGIDRGEVARMTKLRYSDQEAFLATARRTERKQLEHAIQLLAKTDLAIKTSVGGSGPQGARLQIEMLVAQIANQNGL